MLQNVIGHIVPGALGHRGTHVIQSLIIYSRDVKLILVHGPHTAQFDLINNIQFKYYYNIII